MARPRRHGRDLRRDPAAGFNRALAAQGLKVMSGWRNPGLKALMDVAKASGPASVFHVGFILGPRINAGGRIGRSDLGARLLSTDDPEEAAALAEELDALNASRKEVEREVAEAAIAQVEPGEQRAGRIRAGRAQDDWHPGVIGIVAGRLRERYRKPVVVIGIDRAANVGKGSGRSQPGVNLGRAVQAAFDEGLLLAGGGHAMAAGLTVRPDPIPELRAFLCERLAAEIGSPRRTTASRSTPWSPPRGCDRGLWEDFQRLAPFGPGNPGAAVRARRRARRAADGAARRPCALHPDRRIGRQAEGGGLARRGHRGRPTAAVRGRRGACRRPAEARRLARAAKAWSSRSRTSPTPARIRGLEGGGVLRPSGKADIEPRLAPAVPSSIG